MSGTEFFYVDKDGKKQDADLHTDMLDNPEADAKARTRAYENALTHGMSEEDAAALWGADAAAPIGHDEVGEYSDRIDRIQDHGKRERAYQALHARNRRDLHKLLDETP